MKDIQLITSNKIDQIHNVHSLLCRSEELTAIIILDEDGYVCTCNNAATELLETSHSKIAGLHVSKIVPQFSDDDLLQKGKINPDIRYLFHIGFPFELVNFNSKYIDCVLFVNEIRELGKVYFRMIVRPIAIENALN